MDFFPSCRAKRVGKSGMWPSSQPLAQRRVGFRNRQRTGMMRRGAAFDACVYIYIHTHTHVYRYLHMYIYICIHKT